MIGWALLLALLGARAAEPATVSPATADPPWVEAIPLTRFAEPARLFVGDRLDGAVLDGAVLDGAEGLWLVCSGGGGQALACRRDFLPAGAALAVEPGEGVAVRATLRSAREPVAAARVSVTPAGIDARRNVVMPLALDDGELVREVVSGTDGRVALPHLAAGAYWLEIAAPWGRIYRQEVEVPGRDRLGRGAEPVLDLGALELERGSAVALFTADDRGAPVPRASLRVTQGRFGDGEEIVGATATTDAEGFGSVGGLAPHRALQVECFAAGHRPGRVDRAVPPPFVECPLVRAAALAGTVVDAEGRELAGAVLAAPDAARRATSTADGRLELADLPPGAHRMTLAAPGFVAVDLEVELAPGEVRDLGELGLLPGLDVQGVVVDAVSGEPVPGARLASTAPAGAVDVVAGGDGAFVFQTAADRRLELELTAAGYPATPAAVEPEALASGAPLRLALGRAGHLRATVWDEETNAPCGNCSLSLHGPSRVGLLATGAAGEVLSPPLVPGRYDVYLEEVGTEGSSITVHVGRDVRKVEVRPGETASVRFGEPQPRLEVRLSRALPAGWSVRAEGPRGQRVYGAGGARVIEVLRREGEALRLRLSGPGVTVPLAHVAFDFDGDRLDVELPDTWVSGRLASAAAAAEVRLVPLAGGEAGGVWARLGADGIFQVPYLAPGAWAAVVEERVVARFAVAAGRPLDLGLLEPPPGR